MYDVKIGKISIENDLAYLYINAHNIPYATIAKDTQLGENVITLSYDNLLLNSMVSKILKKGILINIESKKGTSGGGIFNSDNELIAILLNTDALAKTSFATSTNIFNEITQDYLNKKELLNQDSDNYDISFCEDEDQLKIWKRHSKAKDIRVQEFHAIFVGLCTKVKNRDLTTESAQYIFEHAQVRLLWK